MNNKFSQTSTHGPATQEPPGNAETKAQFKQSLRDAGQRIKTKTQEVASQVREQGEKYLDQNKTRTAECIGRFSDSLRQTADRFEAEEDPNIAHYTRLAAAKIEGAASYVRERDFAQMRHDTEDLARRHPVLFYGGLFTLGLAAARFLKASGKRDYEALGPEEVPNPNLMAEPIE
jgi:hypothetical protein